MPTLPEANELHAPPPTWRISLELLDANPHQPRREMDEGPLHELMESVRNGGLLQPITVRRIPGGRYQVIAGHRRLEAFRRLLHQALERRDDAGAERFRTIPAHEKFDVTDEEMALFALTENLVRDDLSPLDAALGLAKFQETHQLSVEQLSKRTGLEIDRVKRLLRLSRAPAVIQEACHKGVLVEQLTHSGEVTLLPSGNARHERVRLELIAALEFSRFHANAMKASTAPKTRERAGGLSPQTRLKRADERTAKAIERALTERWTLRHIQTFCKAALTSAGDASGSGPKGSTGAGDTRSEADTQPPVLARPLFTDGDELRIRHSQIRTAPPEQRRALREVLRLMLMKLAG